VILMSATVDYGGDGDDGHGGDNDEEEEEEGGLAAGLSVLVSVDLVKSVCEYFYIHVA
jgi:hypothetical protein